MTRLIQTAMWGLLITVGWYILVMVGLTQVASISGRPAIYYTNEYLGPPGGHAWARFREFDPAGHYDALILGSSHAYRGYDPRLFEAAGWSVFNLGSSSQTMRQTYLLAEAYATTTRTDLLILDLYESALIGDGLESTADLLQNLPPHGPAGKIARAQAGVPALNLWTLRQLRPDSALYTSNSYVGRGYVATSSTAVEDRPAYRETADLRKSQLRYLQRILKLAQDRNLPLITVYAPLPSDYQAATDPSFDDWVLPLLVEYNIPFYDYRQGLPLSDTAHFYDGHHLNQAGVAVFNEALLSDVLHERWPSAPAGRPDR